MKVLVTGGNSAIGAAVARRLVAAGQEVVAYDVAGDRLPDGVRHVAGDVRDYPRLIEAASDCQGGLHLAVLAGDSPIQELLSVNVLGAYGFAAAARAAGFANAVLAGSAPVHLPPGKGDDGAYLRTAPGDDHAYDLSKSLQEVIARDFHAHGVPLICVRLGHVVRGAEEANLDDGTPLSELSYCRGGWVALEDAADACVAALRLEPVDGAFEVLNVVGSASGRVRFDVARTERRLGIRLRYRFETYER